MTKVICEIFIAINEDGDWIVTNDDSEALQKLAEDAAATRRASSD